MGIVRREAHSGGDGSNDRRALGLDGHPSHTDHRREGNCTRTKKAWPTGTGTRRATTGLRWVSPSILLLVVEVWPSILKVQAFSKRSGAASELSRREAPKAPLHDSW